MSVSDTRDTCKHDGSTLLVSEEDCRNPSLAIELDDDGTVHYWVGSTEVKADVYRDVVATHQACFLRTIEDACDHINWHALGQFLEDKL